MTITLQRFSADKSSADAVALFLPQDEAVRRSLSDKLKSLWPAASAALDSGDLAGSKDSVSVAYTGMAKLPRLIVVGVGEQGSVDLERLRRAAAAAGQRAQSLKCSNLAVMVPDFAQLAPRELAQSVVEGLMLGTYSYDKYFTERKDLKKINKFLLWTESDENLKELKKGVSDGEIVANGVILARDLANAPSNELDPQELANRASALDKVGVKVTVLDKKQIQKLGMGGLLGVNQGSLKAPFFVIMEWNGGRKGEQPIVLVGKGITFDSGGISIKPGAGMAEMKMDMGGAAAVIGAMQAIAELKVGRNVVGLVPTTDNMPSGSAYKPGDVLTFLNGKTAEIDNTDAEGRLILADALAYAERYKPQAVIDLATLTGACVIALGNVASGLMGNNPALNDRIREAGDRTYDRVVELPLYEEYEELIKSDIADVKNSGGRAAGTITAALFLQHFIGNYPWAHIDIAGTAMVGKGMGYINKGGTGAPVRLLVDLIRNWDTI